MGGLLVGRAGGQRTRLPARGTSALGTYEWCSVRALSNFMIVALSQHGDHQTTVRSGFTNQRPVSPLFQLIAIDPSAFRVRVFIPSHAHVVPASRLRRWLTSSPGSSSA